MQRLLPSVQCVPPPNPKRTFLPLSHHTKRTGSSTPLQAIPSACEWRACGASRLNEHCRPAQQHSSALHRAAPTPRTLQRCGGSWCACLPSECSCALACKGAAGGRRSTPGRVREAGRSWRWGGSETPATCSAGGTFAVQAACCSAYVPLTVPRLLSFQPPAHQRRAQATRQKNQTHTTGHTKSQKSRAATRKTAQGLHRVGGQW